MNKQLRHYVYLDESLPLPRKLTATIRSLVRIFRGVAPYAKIEDITALDQSDVVQRKSWIVYDNLENLGQIERIDNQDVLLLSDFEDPVVSGNVIQFTIETTDKADALDDPIDSVSGNELDPAAIGERQTYMLIVSLSPMPVKMVDMGSLPLVMTVISRITDNGVFQLASTPDLDIDFQTINGFTLVDEGLETEHWYAEFGTSFGMLVNVLNAFKEVTTVSIKNGANSYRDEVVVPDGDAYWGDATDVLQGPVALQGDFQYGGVSNLIETFTLNAEDPTQSVTREFDIRIDFPIDSIIHTEKIGNFADDTFTVMDVITTTGDITITIGDQTSTVAIDTAVQTDPGLIASHLASNWNIDEYTFTSLDGSITVTSSNVGASYNIPFEVTSPTNPTISGSLTGGSGEEDSNQVPTSTQLDLAGEDIVESVYQFKNYLYIKTDRTDLTGASIDVQWKLSTDPDTSYQAISHNVLVLADTGLTKDLIRVPIPIFGESFNVRVKDTTVNATGRELSAISGGYNRDIFSLSQDSFNTPIDGGISRNDYMVEFTETFNTDIAK